MGEQLKLCPFCGGEAILKISQGFNKEVISAFVYCEECGVATRSYQLEKTAIGAWNRRAYEQNWQLRIWGGIDPERRSDRNKGMQRFTDVYSWVYKRLCSDKRWISGHYDCPGKGGRSIGEVRTGNSWKLTFERDRGGAEIMIMWQYTNDPNDINTAILEKDSNWEGITSENIISITFDTSHMCYVVFWRVWMAE